MSTAMMDKALSMAMSYASYSAVSEKDKMEAAQEWAKEIKAYTAQCTALILAERESQAVQREREAAKGLVERLTIAIEQLEAHRGLFDPTIIRAHKSVLATYNDNR